MRAKQRYVASHLMCLAFIASMTLATPALAWEPGDSCRLSRGEQYFETEQYLDRVTASFDNMYYRKVDSKKVIEKLSNLPDSLDKNESYPHALDYLWYCSIMFNSERSYRLILAEKRVYENGMTDVTDFFWEYLEDFSQSELKLSADIASSGTGPNYTIYLLELLDGDHNMEPYIPLCSLKNYFQFNLNTPDRKLLKSTTIFLDLIYLKNRSGDWGTGKANHLCNFEKDIAALHSRYN